MDGTYDEFGNYIGPELQDSESSDERNDMSESSDEAVKDNVDVVDAVSASRAVVLHEDKRYYAEAEDVYGADVETLVQDEDAQMLSEPILKPDTRAKLHVEDTGPSVSSTEDDWMKQVVSIPNRIRNVAVVGEMHSGKTSLLDALLNVEVGTRYTDVHVDEQQRGISIHCSCVTRCWSDSKSRSMACCWLDTPGHTSLADQVSVAVASCDGIAMTVDCATGLGMGGEQSLRMALRGLWKRQEKGASKGGVVLILTKVDRLVLEVRLPPGDAFHKLRLCVDACNKVLQDEWAILGYAGLCPYLLSPIKGNVLFSSALHGWFFSVKSFVSVMYPSVEDVDNFASRLWGDVWFDEESRRFTNIAPAKLSLMSRRSFVQFVLEPLYKIYSLVVSADYDVMVDALAGLHLYITPAEAKMDVGPLVRLCMSRLFAGGHLQEKGVILSTCVIDAVSEHIPSPTENAVNKTGSVYGDGHTDNDASEASVIQLMKQGAGGVNDERNAGHVMVHVTRCFHRSDKADVFDALGRVMSGTLQDGQRVVVLGEHYTQLEEEDMTIETIQGLWIPCGRRLVPVEKAYPGQIVLIGGVSAHIAKTATICSVDLPFRGIFRPLVHTGSVMKVAVEPVNPSELPKMIEGIRRCGRSYPALQTRVEESGEHVLLGPGELFMDSVLYDLRHTYSDMEVRVSDPSVSFQETVESRSSIACVATTPNGQNRLTMTAQPLEPTIVKAAESGKFHQDNVEELLEQRYGWDMLQAQGLWAFGPYQSSQQSLRAQKRSLVGTCCFLDDTLTDQGTPEWNRLQQARPHMVQGFQWGCREGPLTEEPMRGVSLRLVNALLAPEPFQRGGGQLIPATRRVIYSSVLTARPRLMEPILRVEVQCPVEAIQGVSAVVSRRRGHVVSEELVPATSWARISCLVPAIDAFGLETDVRIHTQGLAYPALVFDHWEVVPGDPLDSSIVLKPLEPAPVMHLAREFMVKTRRRKGLSDDVSIVHFFDAGDEKAEKLRTLLSTK